MRRQPPLSTNSCAKLLVWLEEVCRHNHSSPKEANSKETLKAVRSHLGRCVEDKYVFVQSCCRSGIASHRKLCIVSCSHIMCKPPAANSNLYLYSTYRECLRKSAPSHHPISIPKNRNKPPPHPFRTNIHIRKPRLRKMHPPGIRRARRRRHSDRRIRRRRHAHRQRPRRRRRRLRHAPQNISIDVNFYVLRWLSRWSGVHDVEEACAERDGCEP